MVLWTPVRIKHVGDTWNRIIQIRELPPKLPHSSSKILYRWENNLDAPCLNIS